jgi:hypothetical protein
MPKDEGEGKFGLQGEAVHLRISSTIKVPLKLGEMVIPPETSR